MQIDLHCQIRHQIGKELQAKLKHFFIDPSTRMELRISSNMTVAGWPPEWSFVLVRDDNTIYGPVIHTTVYCGNGYLWAALGNKEKRYELANPAFPKNLFDEVFRVLTMRCDRLKAANKI